MKASRRTFLTASALGLTATGLSSGIWASNARTASGAPLRLVLWPALNGCADEYFWPKDGAMNLVTEPLSAFSKQVTFIRGLGIEGSFNHFAVRSMFTGAPINDYLAPDPTVASVDQVVAEHFKQTNPSALRSLHLGSIPADSIELFQRYGRSTFFFDPTPVYYDANPVTAFDKVFSARRAGVRSDADIERAVLELTRQEIAELKSRASGSPREQEKLKEHLAALDSLDPGNETEHPEGCNMDSLASVEKLRASLEGNEAEAYKHAYYSDIIDANIDIMAKSLVCGLTRVATLQNNSADGNVTVPVGAGLPHHNTSHGDGRTFAEVQLWYMKKFVRLLEALNVPDPLDKEGNTVLHNSCVVWLSECMPIDHGSMIVPSFYAGSAGGLLRAGELVQVEGATNKQLLKTICQVMGVPDSASSHFGGDQLSEIKV